MHPDDLQQALQTLGLHGIDDPEALKHSLYRILLENPSDPRTARLTSRERTARYELALEVKEALFPDKKGPSRELVLQNRVAALVRRTVAEEQQKEERRTREQERIIRNHHASTKKRYATPRLTSAILATVFGVVLGLSKTWEENPIFTPFRKALATQEYKQKSKELAKRALPVARRADSVFATAAAFVRRDSLTISPQNFTESFANLSSSPSQAFTQLQAQIEEAQQDFRKVIAFADSSRKMDAELVQRVDAILGTQGGRITDSVRYAHAAAVRDSIPLKRAASERARDSLLAIAEPLYASKDDSAAIAMRDSALEARRYSFRRDSLDIFTSAEAQWPRIRNESTEPLYQGFDDLIRTLLLRLAEDERFYQYARDRPQLRFGLEVIDSLRALRNGWLADSSRIELHLQSILANSRRPGLQRPSRRQQELAQVETALARLRENERIISAEIARFERSARSGAESRAERYRAEHASDRTRVKVVRAVTYELARSAFQIHVLQEELGKAREDSDRRADETITLVLVASLLVTGFAYLVFWLRERSDERWGDLLATDSATELVMDRILQRARWEQEEMIFSQTTLAEAVATKDIPPPLHLILGSRLDEGRAAPLAAMLLKRLLDRQAIMQRSSSTVVDWYVVHPRVLAEYGIGRSPGSASAKI
jgi:hypothetical protein